MLTHAHTCTCANIQEQAQRPVRLHCEKYGAGSQRLAYGSRQSCDGYDATLAWICHSLNKFIRGCSQRGALPASVYLSAKVRLDRSAAVSLVRMCHAKALNKQHVWSRWLFIVELCRTLQDSRETETAAVLPPTLTSMVVKAACQHSIPPSLPGPQGLQPAASRNAHQLACMSTSRVPGCHALLLAMKKMAAASPSVARKPMHIRSTCIARSPRHQPQC